MAPVESEPAGHRGGTSKRHDAFLDQCRQVGP
jgi:hypothetical protein